MSNAHLNSQGRLANTTIAQDHQLVQRHFARHGDSAGRPEGDRGEDREETREGEKRKKKEENKKRKEQLVNFVLFEFFFVFYLEFSRQKVGWISEWRGSEGGRKRE